MARWQAASLALVLAGAPMSAVASPPSPIQVAAGPNRPPVWDDDPFGNEPERLSTSGYFNRSIRAHDPDFDPVTFTLSNLPRGADVRWVLEEQRDDEGRLRSSFYYPEISWTPGDAQSGAFEFDVTATDGKLSIQRKVRLIVEEEWETFLMPGASYSLWAPAAEESLGMFHGPSAELLIAGWIHRTENRGPSHVRIYLSLGLLSSTRAELSKAVQTSFGFDLSFERNPTRRFLIPYFGLEAGYMFQTQIDKSAWFLPLLGLRAWGDRNLFVNLSGGYLFPTSDVDHLRGWYGRAGINASLW